MKLALSLIAGLLLAHLQRAPLPAVIPQPVSLTPGTDRFTLTAGTVIWR